MKKILIIFLFLFNSVISEEISSSQSINHELYQFIEKRIKACEYYKMTLGKEENFDQYTLGALFAYEDILNFLITND